MSIPPSSLTTIDSTESSTARLPINAITAVLQLLRQTQRPHARDRLRLGLPHQPYHVPYSPTYLDYSYILSAGSKGYCALKEMLQNGVPGYTIMVESHDLRDVGTHTNPNYIIFQIIRPMMHYKSTGITYDRVYFRKYQHLSRAAISLTIYTNTTGIPELFMRRDEVQINLDLSNLTRQTTFPVGFLRGCGCVVSVTLSPHVSLAAYFLADCRNLSTLDLSPLSSPSASLSTSIVGDTTLTELPEGFLSGCVGITYIDLAPLSRLNILPRGFLGGCSGLTVLDLSPLTHLVQFPGDFLEGCSGLTKLTLSQTHHEGPSFQTKTHDGVNIVYV